MLSNDAHVNSRLDTMMMMMMMMIVLHRVARKTKQKRMKNSASEIGK